MASIANLAAKITANAAQFDSVMEKSAKQIGHLEKRINNIRAPFLKLKNVLSLLVATLAVGYIHSVATAGVRTLRFSRLVGSTVVNVMAFRDALRQFGVEAETADEIIGGLVKTIASAVNGNAALRDTFKRLGGDSFLDEISKLDPVEQFKRIADAISKIEDANVRASLATQIFGEHATDVIATLTQGSDAVGKQQRAVNAFGMSFKNIDVSKVEMAQRTFDNLQATLEKLVLQIAIQLAPWLAHLLEYFEQNTTSGNMFIDTIKGIGKAMAYVYVFLNNFVVVIQLLFQGLYQGLKLIAIGVAWVIQKLAKAFAWLTKEGLFKETSKEAKELAESIGRDRDEMIGGIRDGNDEIDRLIGQLKGFASVGEIFDDISIGADTSAKNLDRAAKAGGALQKAFANAELYKKGLQITEENQTGLEKFNTTLMELDKLLDAGAITWETYAKAVAKATNELESNYNLANVSLPSAKRGNTSEALSAINRSTMENNLRTKETPQQRLERLQKEANATAKQQLEYAKQIAEAAKNRKVIVIK